MQRQAARRAAIVLTLSAAALAPGAASAQGVGSGVQDRRPVAPWVSSFGGWMVWSEAVDGKYRLFARRHGRTEQLPAPPGRVTHDPGAGRGPTGRPSAVYQRCTAARCSIWLVDLESRVQRRVQRLGAIRRETGRASDEDALFVETHPRIWGHRVAFKTGGSEAVQPRLRVGPASRDGGKVRTIRVRPGEDGGQLEQLALGPGHVVALWQDDFCFGRCIGLYIHGLASGRQGLLDDAGGTESCVAHVHSVRFDGTAFRWSRELNAIQSGDTGCPPKVTRLRYDPRTGRRTAR